MSFNTNHSAQKRGNPFSRNGPPSPVPGSNGRPKSGIFNSPAATPHDGSSPLHKRSQSAVSAGIGGLPTLGTSKQERRDSRAGTPTSNTFAPSFIKSEELKRDAEVVKGIEGENDFSGKRYVWLKDPQEAFVKGWVIEEKGSNIVVQTDDGTVSTLHSK